MMKIMMVLMIVLIFAQTPIQIIELIMMAVLALKKIVMTATPVQMIVVILIQESVILKLIIVIFAVIRHNSIHIAREGKRKHDTHPRRVLVDRWQSARQSHAYGTDVCIWRITVCIRTRAEHLRLALKLNVNLYANCYTISTHYILLF